jgi:hypothetical protein
VVEKATGHTIDIPESVGGLFALEKKSIVIPPDYQELKNYLLSIA